MVHFVNNSPIIANRNEIRVYVQANMQVDSITCSLTRTGIPPKNPTLSELKLIIFLFFVNCQCILMAMVLSS